MSRPLLLLCLLLLLSLTACQAQPTALDTASLEERLADLEPRLAALEAQIREAAPSPSDDPAASTSIEQIGARMAALEAQLRSGEGAQAPAADGSSAVYQVALTTFELDNAGFHGMDDALNGGESINPSDAGRVQRIARLVAATTWPPELAAEADAFLLTLNEFAAALADDDLDAAAPLATQAHDEQHDLSHHVETWLAAQGVISGGDHGE